MTSLAGKNMKTRFHSSMRKMYSSVGNDSIRQCGQSSRVKVEKRQNISDISHTHPTQNYVGLPRKTCQAAPCTCVVKSFPSGRPMPRSSDRRLVLAVSTRPKPRLVASGQTDALFPLRNGRTVCVLIFRVMLLTHKDFGMTMNDS